MPTGIKNKKILYFIDGTAPTVAEAAEITALNALCKTDNPVQIRSKLQSSVYAAGEIESSDAVAAEAGAVPTAYSAVPLAATLTNYVSKVYPTTLALPSGTSQLRVVACDGVAITDVTAGSTGTTYVSSDEAKATVSANGLVTKVAAGETTITATYKGVATTCVVTVS